MSEIWNKFLQWLCPHKFFKYVIKEAGYENQVNMIESQKVCEDCGKILSSCRAVDWGTLGVRKP